MASVRRVRQPAQVLRTILRNHARPLPPVKVRKYRKARSDASWTTSSASCSFRINQRASRYAASRCGSTTSSKLSLCAGIRSDGRDSVLMLLLCPVRSVDDASSSDHPRHPHATRTAVQRATGPLRSGKRGVSEKVELEIVTLKWMEGAPGLLTARYQCI